jgi:hypothetical protein
MDLLDPSSEMHSVKVDMVGQRSQIDTMLFRFLLPGFCFPADRQLPHRIIRNLRFWGFGGSVPPPSMIIKQRALTREPRGIDYDD